MSFHYLPNDYFWWYEMTPTERRLAREMGVIRFKKPTVWQRVKAFWLQFWP